ncbi:DedA family protein [Halalkalibacter urbisdiaboli]|uniref:DedA family protein n=1 Tax=Halalkalibacter urbisdiaboli TaxID=1960589 RepID=UPI000B437553|nr:DedA family protein [Halalkalibacter urbisdiaboli]
MDLATMIQVVQSHGYLALFFIFMIGLFFFPVPNELLLMSGGWLATTNLLEPIPSFLIIYLTVFFHGSILYVVGTELSKRTHFSKFHHLIWYKRAERGRELLDQHGLKAASFSYFFPFIRHAVPFSVGVSDISYRKFALVSFSSAFIWVGLYFLIGLYFGRSIHNWTTFIDQLLLSFIIIVSFLFIYQVIKKRKRNIKMNKYVE